MKLPLRGHLTKLSIMLDQAVHVTKLVQDATIGRAYHPRHLVGVQVFHETAELKLRFEDRSDFTQTGVHPPFHEFLADLQALVVQWSPVRYFESAGNLSDNPHTMHDGRTTQESRIQSEQQEDIQQTSARLQINPRLSRTKRAARKSRLTGLPAAPCMPGLPGTPVGPMTPGVPCCPGTPGALRRTRHQINTA